jgi:hypothetical protein
MATGIFGSLFRRAPRALDYPPKFRYDVKSNPYQCKRPWPPNFEELSQKHQFRLERRYRRRTKLKWARPVWKKWVTLAQWGSIVSVLVYGVLYLDVKDGRGGRTVFDGIRKWWGDVTSSPRSARPMSTDGDDTQAQKG